MPKLSEGEILKRSRAFIRSWLNATATFRQSARKDYAYVDGRQWQEKDARQVLASGRPVITTNLILPQVELVAGIQRGMILDYVAKPRGMEDKRLAEVATAALKAVNDFGRVQRTTERVFDDGTICGLGAWEGLHTFDDSDDLLWGDTKISRIPPLSFIWDPWSVEPDMQDGNFMGKAWWESLESLKERYPDATIPMGPPGEWLDARDLVSDPQDLGLGPSMLSELYDAETGRHRVLQIWDKRPMEIVLLADQETGKVTEVKNKKTGEQLLARLAETEGRAFAGRFALIQSGEEHVIVDRSSALPMPAPGSSVPLMFVDRPAAQAHLDGLAKQAGMAVYDRYATITRKARKPYVTELVWWQILQTHESPFRDRRYPFVPYISRQFSDDPTSIQGIVRAMTDSQDENNKRRSQLMAHLNSSAHSGWLNRKSGGADSKLLELMGARPGIVVDYATVKPERIEPVNISQGHFMMLQDSAANIRTISGINNEMVGATTQATVSGRAIRARQQGGLTILQPRLRSFEEANLDVARMQFSRIQQYWPVEKIRRVIGVAEAQSPLGANGQPLFAGMSDGQIVAELTQLQQGQFDLALQTVPATPTERQSQFEQAVQIIGMVSSTGRPIGPATFQAMIEMSDMPTKLEAALKQDAAQPPDPAMMGEGGTNERLNAMISNIRGGKAGASEGALGGQQ